MKKMVILTAILLLALAAPSFAAPNPFNTTVGVSIHGLKSATPSINVTSNVFTQVAVATGLFVDAVGNYLQPGSAITGTAAIKSSVTTPTVSYDTASSPGKSMTELSVGGATVTASSFIQFTGTIAGSLY